MIVAAAVTGLRRARVARQRLLAASALALAVSLMLATPAHADAAWWQAGVEASPTNLPPGGEAEVVVVASNLGDAAVNGAKTPVKITNRLPAGLKATAVTGSNTGGVEVKCPSGASPPAPLSCTFEGTVNPYEWVTFTIKVKVEEPPGTVTALPDEVTVEGGGAGRVSSSQRLSVSGEATPFGTQAFELTPQNDDGTPATQAGAHPFQLTTTLVMNEAPGASGPQPVALPKDLSFNLPPGLLGNPSAAVQCGEVDFTALVLETNLCPPRSVVGVATVVANEPATVHIITKTVPVFNLVPAQGEPARLGFEVLGRLPIVIDTAVRSGKDYGVVATVRNVTQVAGLLSSKVTLWGVPGDQRHNNSRGWECVEGGHYQLQIKKSCPTAPSLPQEPFLTMPTSCPADPAAEPLLSSVEADSWAKPGSYQLAEYAWADREGQGLSTEGCSQLPFMPDINVRPEQHSTNTPTGLTVDVKVPQKTTLEAQGLAEADVRDTTVTLPQGVELSPSAANGLQACSEQEIGFVGRNSQTQTDEFTPDEAQCPDAAKLGSVHIKTPLLSHELEGSVYLASPAPNGEGGENPFNSLLALYLVAEDPISGVRVKLAGEGHIDEGTLQISTSFRNSPQVPFEELRLELFGGPRASVTTPPMCGSYSTNASFTPWSGTGTLDVNSPAEAFQITSGCSSPLAFSPGFLAGSQNPGAGQFTNFSLELARADGNQALRGLTMHLPTGDAAMLSSVQPCGPAQAAAAACPAGSLVGEATAVAGLGPEPYTETGGRVYITGPYGGAPFGVEIVTPAAAGPFDLGTVVVRSRLYVDPNDASVTIVSDPLPTELRGIPLQLKRVLVSVDRPNFEFNPTSCSPMRIDGTITGAQGASAAVSSPFQVAGCQNLPFKPKLTASTKGQASKADGANFNVKVESKGLGQANIAKVRLQLPKTLPARLTTLQKACTEKAFGADPASCPEGSVIGTATIHTPVLSSPLAGPAYLVSHGGAAFPDVEFVLQGEGITLVLDGKTQIKKQITYSKFESAPDAPFTTFETVLPSGLHSALTTNLPEKSHFNLCKSRLSMPTEIVGQNGAVLKQTTKIVLQGCKKVKASRPRSRAQLLKRALAACRKERRHARSTRIACEQKARRLYAGAKASHMVNTNARGRRKDG